jgi:uncharacterized protein (DUF433 family)
MTYPYVISDPLICVGQPHVQGTRITVQRIALEVEHLGMTPDEVLAAHPHLTLAQVHAALAYFYDHRQEVERGVEELDAIEQELRARFPSRVQQLLSAKSI